MIKKEELTKNTKRVCVNGLKTTVILSTLLAASVSHAYTFDVGGTKASVYGYTQATFIYDLDHDLGSTTGGIQSLPSSAGQSGTKFQAHAKQTRFGLQTQTDKLQTKIEGDFFGSGNTTFRLRHAYGQYGNWLAGQTWTTFMPLSALPGTADFQGVTGAAFARQTQLRYTTGGLSVALEDPVLPSDQPALIAAYKHKSGGRTLRVAGLWNADVENAAGQEDDAVAIILSADTPLWKGGRLQAQYATGSAFTPYLTNGAGGGDLIDDSGDATDADAYLVALTHKVGPGTAGIMYGKIEHDTGPVGSTESIETIHLNYHFKPVKGITVGLEYFTGERELVGGGTSDADRILSTVRYTF